MSLRHFAGLPMALAPFVCLPTPARTVPSDFDPQALLAPLRLPNPANAIRDGGRCKADAGSRT